METEVNDRFYELVNRTAVSHVCSHEDVIEFCSRWFISERRNMEDLPRVLDLYGTCRDLGHNHTMVTDSIVIMLNHNSVPASIPSDMARRMELLRIELMQVDRKIQQKIIGEDIRLIRND